MIMHLNTSATKKNKKKKNNELKLVNLKVNAQEPFKHSNKITVSSITFMQRRSVHFLKIPLWFGTDALSHSHGYKSL